MAAQAPSHEHHEAVEAGMMEKIGGWEELTGAGGARSLYFASARYRELAMNGDKL